MLSAKQVGQRSLVQEGSATFEHCCMTASTLFLQFNRTNRVVSILHSNTQTHWDILSHQNLSDFMIIVDYSVLSYMVCNMCYTFYVLLTF